MSLSKEDLSAIAALLQEQDKRFDKKLGKQSKRLENLLDKRLRKTENAILLPLNRNDSNQSTIDTSWKP